MSRHEDSIKMRITEIKRKLKKKKNGIKNKNTGKQKNYDDNNTRIVQHQNRSPGLFNFFFFGSYFLYYVHHFSFSPRFFFWPCLLSSLLFQAKKKKYLVLKSAIYPLPLYTISSSSTIFGYCKC